MKKIDILVTLQYNNSYIIVAQIENIIVPTVITDLSLSLCRPLVAPDASYVDPLGPQTERPKTAAKKRGDESDFADEELGDDLLPE